jgi:hypothetical protein
MTNIMGISEAVGIAEGTIEVDSEEQLIAAWQYLVDSGLVWQLQGWFGRTAAQLIEDGILLPPNKSNLLTAAKALNKIEFVHVN